MEKALVSALFFLFRNFPEERQGNCLPKSGSPIALISASPEEAINQSQELRGQNRSHRCPHNRPPDKCFPSCERRTSVHQGSHSAPVLDRRSIRSHEHARKVRHFVGVSTMEDISPGVEIRGGGRALHFVEERSLLFLLC